MCVARLFEINETRFCHLFVFRASSFWSYNEAVDVKHPKRVLRSLRLYFCLLFGRDAAIDNPVLRDEVKLVKKKVASQLGGVSVHSDTRHEKCLFFFYRVLLNCVKRKGKG